MILEVVIKVVKVVPVKLVSIYLFIQFIAYRQLLSSIFEY